MHATVKTISRFLALTAILFAAASTASASDWAEYRTENFLIYSDADPDLVRGLAEDLEVFRRYLIRLTNVDEEFIAQKKAAGLDRRFLVYGLGNTTSFERLTGSNALSFSVQHPRGVVAYANFGVHPDPFEGKRGKPGREQLFYEYTQYFLKQYSNFNYPIWYAQGLGLYLSTFEVENGVANVGLPPLRTVRILGSAFSHHMLPIDDVLGSTRQYSEGILKQGEAVEWNSFSGVGRQGAGAAGAVIDHNHSGVLNADTAVFVVKYQAWGIVHYLQTDAERRKKMINYLIRLDAGEDYAEAFEAVFGQDMEAFAEDVYDYTERKLFPSLRMEFASRAEGAGVAVAELTDTQARFVTAQAKSYLLGQKKRLFAIKNQLLDFKGDLRDMAEVTVAEMEFFTGNPEKAEEIVSGILDRRPDFGRAEGLKGAILLGKGEANEARKYLRRAINRDPNDLVALYYLGHSYVLNPTGKIEEGAAVLARANSIFPQNETIRLELAILDALTGNADYAIPALEDLAAWGSTEDLRRQARSCLSSLEAGQSCSPALVAEN